MLIVKVLVSLRKFLCYLKSHILLENIDCFHSAKTRTLPLETSMNIMSLAVSPNGNIIIVVDEGKY